jgi:monoamine oxidase
MEQVDVVVIGAGISGLVAADALHWAGASVVCLEARDRVGGRALSREGWVDLGATWFWENETAIAELAQRLGVASYPQWTEGDALFEQAPGEIVRLRGNPVDVPCRRLEGGVQALAQRLAAELPDGVVRTGVTVKSIMLDEDGGVQVDDGLVARAVVLALPPALAIATLDITPALDPATADTAAATATWMGDVVKAAARYAEPFWRAEGLAGSAISHVGPFVELHDHGGPEAGQAALFGFAPAQAFAGRDEDQIAAAFTEQLVRLWGERAATPLGVDLVDWSRERYTAPVNPVLGVNTAAYGHVSLALPCKDGRLLFAATETSRAFPGHVEGAIRAGGRAAAHALERLGTR